MTTASAKKTVLVVDDAPSNIRIVNEILHDTYRVRIATDGAKGIELASGSPEPDLILLDVQMPEMDGFEVCRKLKANPATRDIPVIFLTGQTDTVDETKGFEVGAVDYIHKPFSPAVVAARVHTHLALRETRETLERQLLTIRSELDRAREIQRSILPRKIPALAGLDIAARYLPMSEVAGDYYDFLLLDENRLGILVADVSGHGMPAALIASMLKIAFAAQAGGADDPAAVLLGLNRALCGSFQGHFVTAAYALVDTAKRTVRYAGAGHPPLLLRSQQRGDSRYVLENGLFLGSFPTANYSNIEEPFEEGDWLILYTDGLTETRNNEHDLFGEHRLREFVQGAVENSADLMADCLLERLGTWSGRTAVGDPEDDLTLLACHFRG